MYTTRTAPELSRSVACGLGRSNGKPSGTDRPPSRNRVDPSGSSTSAGGWPADAYRSSPLDGSSSIVRIVEKNAPSTPVANRSSEAKIVLGWVIESASARHALRTWPIAAAACRP